MRRRFFLFSFAGLFTFFPPLLLDQEIPPGPLFLFFVQVISKDTDQRSFFPCRSASCSALPCSAKETSPLLFCDLELLCDMKARSFSSPIAPESPPPSFCCKCAVEGSPFLFFLPVDTGHLPPFNRLYVDGSVPPFLP